MSITLQTLRLQSERLQCLRASVSEPLQAGNPLHLGAENPAGASSIQEGQPVCREHKHNFPLKGCCNVPPFMTCSVLLLQYNKKEVFMSKTCSHDLRAPVCPMNTPRRLGQGIRKISVPHEKQKEPSKISSAPVEEHVLVAGTDTG